MTLSQGALPYTVSWQGVGGFVSNSANISNLLPGVYFYTISDASGCVVNDSIVVGVKTGISVSSSRFITCEFGDSILVFANAASNFPMSYQWFTEGGGPLGTDSFEVVNLTNDTNRFVVYVEANGCIVIDTAQIIRGLLPSINPGLDTSIVNGQSVRLGGNPTAPLGGNTYSWSPVATLNSSNVANPIARPSETTTYTVTVTNIYGCSGSMSVTVFVKGKFEFPSGFTPNGDGMNDLWELDFLSDFPDATVVIFNRWGQVVFESKGYRQPWDGTFEGQELPVGTYYYVIDIGRKEISDPITGPITIMR
jgi:gliding motility-associated-like protein